MRFVTIATAKLTEFYRVCGWFGKIKPLFLVTLITDCGLRLAGKRRICRGMNLVAIDAGNICIVVFATFPAYVVFLFMAIQAQAVLLFNGYMRVIAEG